jgi:hypothetical protein
MIDTICLVLIVFGLRVKDTMNILRKLSLWSKWGSKRSPFFKREHFNRNPPSRNWGLSNKRIPQFHKKFLPRGKEWDWYISTSANSRYKTSPFRFSRSFASSHLHIFFRQRGGSLFERHFLDPDYSQ